MGSDTRGDVLSTQQRKQNGQLRELGRVSCHQCEGYITAEFKCEHQKRCMTSIQCNVEFRYKFSTIPGPRNTTERLDRVNRSQDLPDAYPISRQQVVVQVSETNGRPCACNFCFLKLLRFTLQTCLVSPYAPDTGH